MLDRLRSKTFSALKSKTGDKLPGIKLVKKAALMVNDNLGRPLADQVELERRAEFDARNSRNLGSEALVDAAPVPVILWHKGEQRDATSIIKVLGDAGIAFTQRDVADDEPTIEALHREGGGRPLPLLFVADTCLGGANAVRQMASSGELQRLISARGGAVASVPNIGDLGDPALAAQVYGTDTCPWTGRAKSVLEREDVDYSFIDLDSPEGLAYGDKLSLETNHNTQPWVYLRGEFIGGYNALDEIARLGQLEARTRAADAAKRDRRVKIVVADRENSDESAPGDVADRPN